MKRITINTKDGPIELLDDNDEQTTEETIKFLLDMMRGTTVAVVKTSHTSVLVRPSYISGIVVEKDVEYPTKEVTPIKQPEINDEKVEQTIETFTEDIVTDME